MLADITPCINQRQYYLGQAVVSREQFSDVPLEYLTFAPWHDEAKRLHHTTDLVAELDRHARYLLANADQSTGQHGIVTLHANSLVKADLGQLC